MKKDNFEDWLLDATKNNKCKWTDPELWEETKAKHGPLTLENRWELHKIYWTALGKRGSKRYGFFDRDKDLAEFAGRFRKT